MKPPPIHLLATLLAVASAAAAQPAANTPTEVRPVIVPAGPVPQVTASYPPDGGSVAGGVLVLKLVFDQRMAPDGWAFGRSGTEAFPNCLARPRLLADQRTFDLLCTVAPSQSYAIEINPAPDFQTTGGRSAKSFVLHFSTTGDVTRDLHTALTQAGLTDDDEPIMSWDDPGKGVSQAQPVAPEADAPPAH
jgi:hypothetical protein